MSEQAQASPAAKPAIDVASLVAASATGDVNAVRSCLLPVHDAPSSCESWRQRPVAVAERCWADEPSPQTALSITSPTRSRYSVLQ